MHVYVCAHFQTESNSRTCSGADKGFSARNCYKQMELESSSSKPLSTAHRKSGQVPTHTLYLLLPVSVYLAWGMAGVLATAGCRGADTLVTLSPSRTSLSTKESTSLSFFFSLRALPPPCRCDRLHGWENTGVARVIIGQQPDMPHSRGSIAVLI